MVEYAAWRAPRRVRVALAIVRVCRRMARAYVLYGGFHRRRVPGGLARRAEWSACRGRGAWSHAIAGVPLRRFAASGAHFAAAAFRSIHEPRENFIADHGNRSGRSVVRVASGRDRELQDFRGVRCSYRVVYCRHRVDRSRLAYGGACARLLIREALNMTWT